MDTVNEILMPTFIFMVTFCFLCCQVSGKATVHAEIESVPEVEPVAAEPMAEVEPVAAEPVAAEPMTEVEPMAEVERVAVEPVAVEPIAEVEPVATELYEEALKIINGLKKLEARQLCKPLGIQQKRNKIELSKDILIGNIKKKFKENPRLVIELLTEKLNIKFASATANSVKTIKAA